MNEIGSRLLGFPFGWAEVVCKRLIQLLLESWFVQSFPRVERVDCDVCSWPRFAVGLLNEEGTEERVPEGFKEPWLVLGVLNCSYQRR